METKVKYFLIGIIIVLITIVIINSNNNSSSYINHRKELKDYQLKVKQYLKEKDSLSLKVKNLILKQESLLNVYENHRVTTDSIIKLNVNNNEKNIIYINNVNSWDDSTKNEFWTREFSREDKLIYP
jgi:hypothetical protein